MARMASIAAPQVKAGGGGAATTWAPLPPNSAATRITRPSAFSAVPILPAAPPVRAPIQLTTRQPATSRMATCPTDRKVRKPSRCTYSPKATVMNPVETVSWHQSAHPTRKPFRGPMARVTIE